MDNNQTSESLEIDQPQNNIVFNSSDDQSESFDQDLDYSREDQSLSFQIQAFESTQKKPIHIENHTNVITNQPPKRRRRQIFQKYRQPILQQNSIHHSQSVSHEQDIMRTFDQIFNINSPKKQNNVFNVKVEDSGDNKIFKKKTSIKEVQIQPVSTHKKQIIGSRKDDSIKDEVFDDDVEIVKLNQPDLEGSDFFKTPLQKVNTPHKQRLTIGENDILNLQDIQQRFSFIQEKHNVSFSHDSAAIQQILGSQIFKEESERTHIPSKIQTFPQNNFNQQENPKITNEKPLVFANQKMQQMAKIFENIKESQSQLKNESVLQVYEKIDISASVTSSIMVRDPRYYPNQTGFLGTERKIMQSKSAKTIGFFSPSSSEKKISSKLINPQQHLDQTLPIFLRKIHYLNSIYPNFKHPQLVYSPEKQNQSLQKIVLAFLEALRLIERTLKSIEIKQERKNMLMNEYNKNLTVKIFKQAQWKECETVEGIHKFESKVNYKKREWNKKDVLKALQDYKKTSQYYRGAKLNLNDQRGIDKYIDIRRKFWKIEINMIMIAEDIYTHVQEMKFPKYYQQILQVLDADQSSVSHQQLQKMKILLQKIKFLRNKQQLICSSPVGYQCICKIQRVLRLCQPY